MSAPARVIPLDDYRVHCPSCGRRMTPMHRSARSPVKSWRCDPCVEFRIVSPGSPPESRLLPALVIVLTVILAVVVFSYLYRGAP